MFKILIFFFMLVVSNIAFSSNKEKIITQMKLTDNLSFNFVQTINDAREVGNCVIKYPKKIYCNYNSIDKKIIVSNGKSMVIKNNKNYYIYPLKRTPLELLLDKNYLISKIKISNSKIISDAYISFKISEDDNEISIFFDRKTFNLIGWQTVDIYQNLIITYISSIKINKNLNKNLFKLPSKD